MPRIMATTLGLTLLLAIQFPPRPAEAGLGRLLSRWTEGLRLGKVRARQRRQLRRNAGRGYRREKRVETWTRLRYLGSSVQRQKVLLDRRGRPAVDLVTKQSRRLDLAVISPFGHVSVLLEVTSKKADKRAQKEKTRRILKRYRKLYIKDSRDGHLVPLRRGLLFRTRFRLVRRR